VNGWGFADHAVNMNADVQSMNRYFGWYEGRVDGLQGWVDYLEREYPSSKGYKFILGEYGADANIFQQQEIVGDVGEFGGPTANYNESVVTHFHEVQGGIIANSPRLLGSYIWNSFDFGKPVAFQGGVPARNMKGLVTFDRKIRKDAFYWYKANWSKEPVVYLTQRRVIWRENQITTVTVYSNIGVPTLLVNGREITGHRMGTTHVHYVFENVELAEGDNVVVARVTKDGVVHEDTIHWNYSENNKGRGIREVHERLEEHGGL
jgi:beta-galactosidase